MVNNEFHVIGTAVSNYESVTDIKGFSSYLLRIEIERLGSKKGSSFEMVVQIYSSNKVVDIQENVIGKIVAVNGYLDGYTTQNGSLLTKAVVQNVIVLNKKEYYNNAVAGNIEIDE